MPVSTKVQCHSESTVGQAVPSAHTNHGSNTHRNMHSCICAHKQTQIHSLICSHEDTYTQISIGIEIDTCTPKHVDMCACTAINP